jgi:hypothetical protein
MSDVALQSEFSSDRIMPVSWCNPIRSHDGRSGESRSHRGGQGFESPQLHPCGVSGHRNDPEPMIRVRGFWFCGLFRVGVRAGGRWAGSRGRGRW